MKNFFFLIGLPKDFLFETSLPCEDGAIPLTDNSNLLGPYLSRLYYGAIATPTPPRRNNNTSSIRNNTSNTSTYAPKDDNRRHSAHGRICGGTGSSTGISRFLLKVTSLNSKKNNQT